MLSTIRNSSSLGGTTTRRSQTKRQLLPKNSTISTKANKNSKNKLNGDEGKKKDVENGKKITLSEDASIVNVHQKD